MKKKPNRLNPEFQSALKQKLRLRMSLSTKRLMREFDISRTVIDRLTRELKREGLVNVMVKR